MTDIQFDFKLTKYDDRSFSIIQDVFHLGSELGTSHKDCLISFGPLSCDLSVLVNQQGFSLRIDGRLSHTGSLQYQNKVNLYLYRASDGQNYKLRRLELAEVLSSNNKNLFRLLPDELQLITRGAGKVTGPENQMETNPFDILKDKYPLSGPKMIGNMTLREFVHTSLN